MINHSPTSCHFEYHGSHHTLWNNGKQISSTIHVALLQIFENDLYVLPQLFLCELKQMLLQLFLIRLGLQDPHHLYPPLVAIFQIVVSSLQMSVV